MFMLNSVSYVGFGMTRLNGSAGVGDMAKLI
jgi:hypothetical protein